MNKPRFLGAMCTVFLAFIVPPTNAALYSRLAGKVIFDSDRNISWLANGNLAESNTFGIPGINSDGSMDWNNGEPQAWIAAMNVHAGIGYLGINEWRLPDTLHPDDTCSIQTATVSYGQDCTGSEMGHLYYIEFGLSAGEGIGDGSSVTSIGPFKNVRRGTYWSRTPVPNRSTPYTFQFQSGQQRTLSVSDHYAWPVFFGDVLTTLLRCDLNDNGEVDAGDLSQVIRMVVGNIAEDLDCDINNSGFGDGVISTADLVIISRIVLGILPEIYN